MGSSVQNTIFFTPKIPGASAIAVSCTGAESSLLGCQAKTTCETLERVLVICQSPAPPATSSASDGLGVAVGASVGGVMVLVLALAIAFVFFVKRRARVKALTINVPGVTSEA